MIAQSNMNILSPAPLLGGLSPQNFMRRHWQKKPLLVRQAIPGGVALLNRAQMFNLATFDEVESRLVIRHAEHWILRQGPLKRSMIPPLKQPQWTLLLQGLDLHVPAARSLLEHFRFVPDARLDDVMMSFATHGGGVGPHIDSYDVFLLQAQGQRRWRIAKPRKFELVPDVPLKILANFVSEQEWLLEAGDMLYLPPGWAHDGEAEGESWTCSVGFRTLGREEVSREVLQRTLDAADHTEAGPLYRDPTQVATAEPGRIPVALQTFAAQAVTRMLADTNSLQCALGEVLSEPKRGVWFDAPEPGALLIKNTVRLDVRTRMMYDDHHVFLNGESFHAAGRDAKLMRSLADRRELKFSEIQALSGAARLLLNEWLNVGWLRCDDSMPS
jgi:50S ribosomal protein L16 3-hydroxylase